MPDRDSREAPIPEQWRSAVVDALRSSDKKRVQSTRTADLEWQSAFPNAWFNDREDALARAFLADGITGRHITDMEPPCDAYEFWFFFESRRMLGKIGLLPDGRVIIIFSSHIPHKGEDRL